MVVELKANNMRREFEERTIPLFIEGVFKLMMLYKAELEEFFVFTEDELVGVDARYNIDFEVEGGSPVGAEKFGMLVNYIFFKKVFSVAEVVKVTPLLVFLQKKVPEFLAIVFEETGFEYKEMLLTMAGVVTVYATIFQHALADKEEVRINLMRDES